jgi:AraC family transcriptional activator of pobA
LSTPSPTFFLYGEAPTAGQENFLHLEPLDARSRPANWHIKPHRHDDLHHVFLLWSGAGEMRVAAGAETAAAPCLLLVPAGHVHAFSFVPDTTGRVLTISDFFLRGLCQMDDDLAPLFTAARCVAAGGEAPALLEDFDRLGRELAWRTLGHAGAVKAAVLRILVGALRLDLHGPAAAATQTADARLVARFREMVEARFRSHETIGAYASSLGVSLSRLRAACRKQGCGSPLDVLHARRMLEAKRALLYSRTSVSEIAFSLGYDDVSYFVRLFHRLEGVPPGAFRQHEASRPQNQ